MENVEPSDASFGLSTTPVKRPPPGNRPPVFAGRNWIKITYDNKASVIRALAEDGTQFAGQYVIGCKPYTPSQMRDFDAISASMLDSHDASMMDSDYQDSPIKSKFPRLSSRTLASTPTLQHLHLFLLRSEVCLGPHRCLLSTAPSGWRFETEPTPCSSSPPPRPSPTPKSRKRVSLRRRAGCPGPPSGPKSSFSDTRFKRLCED